MPALLSVDEDWLVAGVAGLTDGELVDVATIGVVEMTDAVFVAPTVVPWWRENSKFKFPVSP